MAFSGHKFNKKFELIVLGVLGLVVGIAVVNGTLLTPGTNSLGNFTNNIGTQVTAVSGASALSTPITIVVIILIVLAIIGLVI